MLRRSSVLVPDWPPLTPEFPERGVALPASAGTKLTASAMCARGQHFQFLDTNDGRRRRRFVAVADNARCGHDHRIEQIVCVGRTSRLRFFRCCLGARGRGVSGSLPRLGMNGDRVLVEHGVAERGAFEHGLQGIDDAMAAANFGGHGLRHLVAGGKHLHMGLVGECDQRRGQRLRSNLELRLAGIDVALGGAVDQDRRQCQEQNPQPQLCDDAHGCTGPETNHSFPRRGRVRPAALQGGPFYSVQ